MENKRIVIITGNEARHKYFAGKLANSINVVSVFFEKKANVHQQFDLNIAHLMQQHAFTHFEYQEPDEYRVDEHLKTFVQHASFSHTVHDSEHFYTSRNELGNFFKGKKTFLLESFYRHMRKKHHVLMINDT